MSVLMGCVSAWAAFQEMGFVAISARACSIGQYFRPNNLQMSLVVWMYFDNQPGVTETVSKKFKIWRHISNLIFVLQLAFTVKHHWGPPSVSIFQIFLESTFLQFRAIEWCTKAPQVAIFKVKQSETFRQPSESARNRRIIEIAKQEENHS